MKPMMLCFNHLFLFSLLLISLTLTHSTAQADASISSDGPDSTALDSLSSKIHTLESHIEEKTQEVKDRDQIIAAKDQIIGEKSDSIVSLQSEVASLQVHEAWLPPWLAVHIIRVQSHVEKNWKLHGEPALDKLVQKAIEKKAQAEEWAAQHVEAAKTEEIARTKFEATSKAQGLTKDQVHGAWLPPWLAVHIIRAQSHVEKNWKLHGEPALDKLMQKAIEKKAQAEEWAAPHVETAKTEEIARTKFEATSKAQELTKDQVHGAWLPPWLAVHIIRAQSHVENYWKLHGEPALDKLMQKAIEKKAQTEEWAAQHVEAAKTEEIARTKFEATSKAQELTKDQVHGAWLPPWLAVHIIRAQSHVENYWKLHGEPALDKLMQKAIEKKAQAEEWAAPHVETAKTKWVPAVKDKWVELITHVEPHVQRLTTKSIEIYEVSKKEMTPLTVKVTKTVNPYFQQLWQHLKPYIDQITTTARPHIDKLRTTMEYKHQAIHAYRKFLKSATTYHHHQVQDKVQEKMKSNEIRQPFATKERVWFTASALLALPIIFLLRIRSFPFCKEAAKPVRNGNHSRRKSKRETRTFR